MSRAIEIVRFTVTPGEEQEFLDKRGAMAQAAKEQFEGLVEESLVRLEGGTYMAIWIWAERKFCDIALAKVDQVEPVLSWLSHMDQELSMEFGVVIDADDRVAS